MRAIEAQRHSFPATFAIRAVHDEVTGNGMRLRSSDQFIDTATIIGQRAVSTVYFHQKDPSTIEQHREARSHPNSVYFQFLALGIPLTTVEQHWVPKAAIPGDLKEYQDTVPASAEGGAGDTPSSKARL